VTVFDNAFPTIQGVLKSYVVKPFELIIITANKCTYDTCQCTCKQRNNKTPFFN
jgi:hypothetical protein